MTRDRADLGFSDSLNTLDLSDFVPDPQPQTRIRPEASMARFLAEKAGFNSRESAGEGGAPPVALTQSMNVPEPVRRRRTGRNAQFNLKAKPETIAAFCAVADHNGWGLGETLEYAVKLLQSEYSR